MADHGRQIILAHVGRSCATLVCVLLAYYSLPLRLRATSEIVGLVVFVVGIVGLTWLIAHQARRYVAVPGDTTERVLSVLTAVYVVIVFFAVSYFLIERNSPGQFVGLETRTDALYYAVVTLGTVGYGDVSAVGQTARVVTMAQITFDLAVLGVLFAVASAEVADRVRSHSGRR